MAVLLRAVVVFLCLFAGFANPATMSSAFAFGTEPLSSAEIDELLERLAQAEDRTEAVVIEGLIVAAWSRSESPTATLLYNRGLEALDHDDLELSLDLSGNGH